MTFKKAFGVLALMAFISFGAFAQNSVILGQWKTVDDETGKEKSFLEIYEKGGKVYGKIVKLLLKEDQGKKCDACKGSQKGQPIEGMTIMKDMERVSDGWDEGSIMDPKNGKSYSCYLKLKGKDTLLVKGYMGFRALGRTQVWHRVR